MHRDFASLASETGGTGTLSVRCHISGVHSAAAYFGRSCSRRSFRLVVLSRAWDLVGHSLAHATYPGGHITHEYKSNDASPEHN